MTSQPGAGGPHALCVGHADSPQFARRCALLMRAGCRVTELTGREDPVTPGAGCATPRGLPLGRAWRLTAMSRVADYFSLLRRAAPDVIFAQYAHGLWAWLAPLSGLPLAVCVMGGDVLPDEQGDPGPWLRLATRGLLRRAGLVLCSSGPLAERVRALGPSGLVEVFDWGPDEEIFRPGGRAEARAALGLPEEGRIVFSPRAMQPLYRIAEIAEAFALAHAGDAGARLLLATFRAQPGYLDKVRRRCAELGLGGRVIFLPPQTPEGMAACYRAADLCVSYPSSDGLPQSFLEAAACGAPMVLSDLAKYNAIIRHGEHALLAHGTPALAEALRQAAHRPEGLRPLARNAAALLKGRSSLDQARRLRRLLDECAARPRPARLSCLPQLLLVLAALASGRPVAARTGQPVYATARSFLRAQAAPKP